MAIATLVETIGSAPFSPGATMLVDRAGNIEGSVTGGCVEGALVEEASAVLAGGPPRLRSYGISDELAGSVGLACGGTVQIFVERLSAEAAPVLDAVLAQREDGGPSAVATLLDGPHAGSRLALVADEQLGGLGAGELLDHNAAREMRGMLDRGVTGLRRYGDDGATMGDAIRVHVASFAPAPRMVIVGAIDYSAAVARLAGELGYRVTIVDIRKPFLRSPRFSDAAEVVVAWPGEYLDAQLLGERDAVLVFSHDPKLDEPATIAALRSGAGYVGALGSRRTQVERAARLRAQGLSQQQLERVAAPCGLDIGASTPAETAVSVLAEIIAFHSGRSGEPLAESSGPIHAVGEDAEA